MLNLNERTNDSVQIPSEIEAALFLNTNDDLVLKEQDGTIKYVKLSKTKEPLIYRAILTQSGTSAPVATVLQNDFDDDITYTYTSIGTYTATATGLLNNTTGIEISGGHNSTNSSDVPIFGIKEQTNNNFIITSGDSLNQGLFNGILNKTLLTIYKY